MKKLHLSDLKTVKKVKCVSNNIDCLCANQIYEVIRTSEDIYVECAYGPHILAAHLADDENFIPEFEVVA